MYKIGTFLYSLERAVDEQKARDIDEAMYKAAESGVSAIDIPCTIVDSYSENNLNALINKNGMSIASVHCAYPVNYKSIDAYRKSVEEYKLAADFAKEMKSPYLMLVPQTPDDYKTLDFIKFRQGARNLIGEIASYCADIGIVPTIEDYSDRTNVCGRTDAIKYLLDKNPKLMFTYDSGNFVLAGYNEVETAQIFADRTVYVHLKDLVYDEEHFEFVRDGIAYDSVAIGDGFLRIKEALDILRDGKFKEGTITIESGYEYDSFEKMLKSAQYLKEIL